MKHNESPSCRVSDEMTVLALNNLWWMKTNLANIHSVIIKHSSVARPPSLREPK